MPNEMHVPPSPLTLPPNTAEGGTAGPQFSSDSGARLTFLIQEHQYLLDTIKFSDQKAAFVFAFAVGVMTLGYNLRLYERISGRVLDWAGGNWLSAFALVLIFVSAALSVATLLPRLWSHKGHGVVYFQHILMHGSETAYASAILAIKDTEILSELSSHCYTLGAIAQRKFVYTKWALWAGGLGGVLTMAAVAGPSGAHPANNSQQALDAIDHAAAGVVAALEVELPLSDLSERVAMLGAGLHAIGSTGISIQQQQLLKRFRDGYDATIRLMKMLNRDLDLKPTNLVRKEGKGTAHLEARTPPEALMRVRQEVTALFEEAHSYLWLTRRE